MAKNSFLSGVYAAAVTPLKPDLSPDLDGLGNLFQFLSTRGCHGVLVMGTTGEGPSFSIKERMVIYEHAAKVRQSIPEFQILAGTGTPSLGDTVFLTKAAFDLGFDAVVVLPPYYYRKAPEDGLLSWFSQVIQQAVPSDGALLGYHIPPVSGVNLSLDLLWRLKESFPDQFSGIKDSSADPHWAQLLGERFGHNLVVLNGNDKLFTLSLQSHGSGCITAMANLLSPIHRLVWDQFKSGNLNEADQEKLSHAREVLDRHQPMPPLLKVLLSQLHGFPTWKVKPPLLELDSSQVEIIISEFLAAVE
jgi:4-hydroxy-tetrahydrodipicolinate synthase